MKILITGNPKKDLCQEVVSLLQQKGHECHCVSRATGHDFEKDTGGTIKKIVELSESCDVFINLYANYFFNATIMAHKVYNNWITKNMNDKRMINVGSTTDRVRKAKNNLYHYEKLILRDWSAGLALMGVWDGGPRVSHISFGTLDNRAEKHGDRKCLSIKKAAEYLCWILDQPKDININELCVDPIQ